MKLAFDVDGVITEFPELYSILTDSLVKNGHEVYIISDYDEHFRKERERELAQYDIVYTEFIITGNKKEYCQENGIDYAFDDDISYYPNTVRSDLSVFKI